MSFLEERIDPKSQLSTILLKPRELTTKMAETLEDYILSLHGLDENSKEVYLGHLLNLFFHVLCHPLCSLEYVD
jgi:hypothetical protein